MVWQVGSILRAEKIRPGIIDGLFYSNASYGDCGSVDCCSDGTRFFALRQEEGYRAHN